MSATTGLRITGIHNQQGGAREVNDEYVVILNESTQTQSLAGYALTCRTAGQQSDYIYTLPGRVYTAGHGVGGWVCGPGALVFIRSGEGRDEFFPGSDGVPAQFHFYAGRHDFIWSATGDRVYLRHPHGQFVTEPFPVP